MAWEWIVLIAITIIGPTVFQRFIPTMQQVTVRGGAVFTIRYSLFAQIMRTTVKFGFVWLIAFGLAQLENRIWLRLWIIGGPLIGLVGHFVYVHRFKVHWLSGHQLPDPT